jgi:hypothetical protein
MQPLSPFRGEVAEWIQPKASLPSYHLRSDDALLVTLSFRSACGTLATAQTAEGVWTFKRVGFLNPRVTIRLAGSDEDAAVYQPKIWGDGLLTCKSGKAFVWRPINFWATDWAFTDTQENQLLRLKGGLEKEGLRDLFKDQATVELAPAAQEVQELPILVCLGIYLLILRRLDAAAAIAATAGASAA